MTDFKYTSEGFQMVCDFFNKEIQICGFVSINDVARAAQSFEQNTNAPRSVHIDNCKTGVFSLYSQSDWICLQITIDGFISPVWFLGYSSSGNKKQNNLFYATRQRSVLTRKIQEKIEEERLLQMVPEEHVGILGI